MEVKSLEPVFSGLLYRIMVYNTKESEHSTIGAGFLKRIGYFHHTRGFLLMYHFLTPDGGFLSRYLCQPQQDTVCRSALPLLLLTKPENRLVSPGSSKRSLS